MNVVAQPSQPQMLAGPRGRQQRAQVSTRVQGEFGSLPAVFSMDWSRSMVETLDMHVYGHHSPTPNPPVNSK